MISLLSLLLVTMSGCKKYEKIRIVSATVESVNMKGLRAAETVLSVRIDNPAGKVVLEDVKGTLKHSGKILGSVTLVPFTLEPRTVSDYRVAAMLELDGSVGLMSLMSFMNVRKLKECTVDISAQGKVAGIKAKKEYKDIPVKRLLEENYYEKI